MEEIWKDIQDHYGYEVSTLGNVRSFRNPNGKGFVDNYKLLKQYNKKGYLQVCLDRKYIGVHRLVAKAFIPNPEELPQVNHKDENPTNNTVENLEWCSAKYNVNYGTAIERTKAKTRNDPNRSKPVLCVELNKVFPSIMEAARFINQKAAKYCISSCCNEKVRVDRNGKIHLQKTAYGYHWRYA